MPSDATSRSRILVVDDDRLVLSTLCMGLMRAGYQVEAVDNAEAAVDACDRHIPDIAVLDYNMPNMTGLEVARHIRSHANVPILMLTAYDDIDLIQEAANCGINGYFVKPIDSSQLIPSIELNLKRTGSTMIPADPQNRTALEGRYSVGIGQARGIGPRDPGDPAMGKAVDREQENAILKAITDNRIDLVYQPIVEIKSGEISHYEALLRLVDDDGKHITPGKFLDTAEKSGLIRSLDYRVLQQAVTTLYSMQDILKDRCFSLNLSAVHFGDPELLGCIRTLLNQYRVNPQNLIFEVTETAAMQDLEQARNFIHELKTLGCRFALDDFGTGYASFYYLRCLPVDYIKIDGTFVRELVNSEQDKLFVRAMVDVARGLGIQSIAEYVSDHETLEILGECGVDYAQGYFIGKPAPLPER